MSGEPKPQPRLRYFRQGNRVGGYTPPTADAWKVACAVHAHASIGAPFEGAVRLALWFALPRPVSHLKRDGTLRSFAPARPTTKPDLDNLAKAVMDALTGIAYADDKQVVELISGKQYATESIPVGCIISIEEAEAHAE